MICGASRCVAALHTKCVDAFFFVFFLWKWGACGGDKGHVMSSCTEGAGVHIATHAPPPRPQRAAPEQTADAETACLA